MAGIWWGSILGMSSVMVAYVFIFTIFKTSNIEFRFNRASFSLRFPIENAIYDNDLSGLRDPI